MINTALEIAAFVAAIFSVAQTATAPKKTAPAAAGGASVPGDEGDGRRDQDSSVCIIGYQGPAREPSRTAVITSRWTIPAGSRPQRI